MIDLDKIDDLSRLYRLFTMVPDGLPTLKKATRDSIIRRGKDINFASVPNEGIDPPVDEEPGGSKGKGKAKARTNSANQTLSLALKWVEDVLDLKDKFDRIWSKAFRSDRELEGTLNEVFILFLPPIMIFSSSSNRHLRRSSIKTRKRQSSSRYS